MRTAKNIIATTLLLLMSCWSAFSQADPSFLGTPTSGCAPLTVQFDVYFPQQGLLYLWDYGDGSSGSGVTPDHMYTTAGTYDVSVYIYAWDPNTQDSILVADSTYGAYVTVGGLFLPNGIPATVTDASCGANDGAIDLFPNTGGPTFGYTYAWSNGSTTEDQSNLSPGVYTLTVSDAGGCSLTSTYLISSSSNLNPSIAVLSNSSCSSPTGSVVLNLGAATGGFPPNTYTVTDSLGNAYFPNPNGVVSGLGSGIYNFNIADTTNPGCDAWVSFYVPGDLAITATPSSTTVCPGDSVSVALATSGGTAPYFYGTSPIFIGSQTLFAQAGGTTVTYYGSDASGCSGSVDVTIQQSTPLIINITSTQPSCPACQDGALSATVTGGTAPYQYLWSTGATTAGISGLGAGTYVLEVVDANGCSSRTTEILTSGQTGGGCNFLVSSSIMPASCNSATGSIDLNINNGGASVSIVWSTGATTTAITNLISGTYTAAITDLQVQCTETYAFFVPDTSGLIAFAGNDAFIGGCNGGSQSTTLGGSAIRPTVLGGAPPYTISWSPAAGLDDATIVNPTASPSQTTMYTIIVTDANGCSGADSVLVNVSQGGGSLQVLIFPDSSTGCQGLDLIASTNSIGGPASGTYLWSTGATTQTISVTAPGTYAVEVTDAATGCSGTDTIILAPNFLRSDCVWPGDADNDGIADNNDVLAIGYAYGVTGPSRPNATTNWVGQQAPDWNLALATGANLKHTDCDGDGTIDNSDVAAVNANYGSVHLKDSEKNGDRFVDPPLTYFLPTDTILAGDTLTVPVLFGNQNIPASSVYGLVFSVNYDAALVVPNSMSFDAGTSWMGTTGTDLLDFSYDLYADQRMDVAVTRIDQQNVSGSGQIGSVSFTMKDDISGKSNIIKAIGLSFSKVRLIDKDYSDMPIYFEGGTFYASQFSVGIRAAKDLIEDVRLYPNPATDKLHVELANGTEATLRLIDMMGREYVTTTGQRQMTLDVAAIPAGTYVLQIETENGVAFRRVSLVK